MAVFPRPASPRAAWRDFRQFLRGEQRHKLLFAIIAIIMPMLIVLGLYLDSRTDPPPAQMIYVQNWPADRPDSEIVEQNLADQKKLDAARAKRQQEYQRLAKKLGVE